jgi:hypothetical protein
MQDPDTTGDIGIAHAIMHKFQYNYKDKWVAQKALFQKDRRWVRVFNRLVREGLIIRKKTYHGYQYKWAGRFP